MVKKSRNFQIEPKIDCLPGKTVSLFLYSSLKQIEKFSGPSKV
jgi:hypothetical protein